MLQLLQICVFYISDDLHSLLLEMFKIPAELQCRTVYIRQHDPMSRKIHSLRQFL